MEFGYDRSRLQESGEILLSAVFRVRPGDAAVMRATARASLAFRKRTVLIVIDSVVDRTLHRILWRLNRRRSRS